MTDKPTKDDIYNAWLKLSEAYDNVESRLEDEDPNDPYNNIEILTEEQESLGRVLRWLDGVRSGMIHEAQSIENR